MREGGDAAGPYIGAAQESQNFRPTGFERPQAAHTACAESAAPHPPQNVVSSRFSEPQEVQGTDVP